jgi:hypothetical protein
MTTTRLTRSFALALHALALVAVFAFTVETAQAQSYGILQPGQVIGNNGTTPGLGGPIPARMLQTAPVLLYLSGSGSDTGSCTITAPCATFNYAITYAQTNYDLGSQPVTIVPALNTVYSGGILVNGNGVGDVCNLTIQGSPQQTITTATNASPIVVTYTGNDPTNGDNVTISGVAGNTAANGSWKVASVNTGAKTFALANSTGNGAYTSGGTFYDQSALTISGGANNAVFARNYGCVTFIGGIKLTSTSNLDARALLYGQIIFTNGVQLDATCSGCAQVYATRFGYVQINGGIAVSAGAFAMMEGDHLGAVRWNGSIAGFTANATFSNSILAADGGEVVETGGGSIATNGYTVTAPSGSIAIDDGIIQVEALAPPASAFFGSIPTGAATVWTNTTGPGTNPGITQLPTGVEIYTPIIPGTAHGLIVGENTAPTSEVGPCTTSQVIVGAGTSADPACGSVPLAALPAAATLRGYTEEGMTLLNVVNVTAAATISDTSSLTSAYNDYWIVFDNVTPATNGVGFSCQLQSGGSFQATNYVNQSSGATTYFDVLSGATTLGSTGGLSSDLKIYNVNSTNIKMIRALGTYDSSTSTALAVNGNGFWTGGGAVTGIQCQASTGNVTGSMKIYGLRPAL